MEVDQVEGNKQDIRSREVKYFDKKMFEEPRHRSQSILSNRTNTTWRADVFGKPRLNRGAMVFTGKY